MPRDEKTWTESTISSWNWFDQPLEKQRPREWLFRGHSDSSWKLRKSLDRLFEDAQVIIRNAKSKDRTFAKRAHEELLIKSFQKNSNLFRKFLPVTWIRQIAKRQLLDCEGSHKQLARVGQNSQRRTLAFGFSWVTVILNRAASSQ